MQRATEQATYLTLIANIVNTVIAGAAYRAEIEATQELIELQREQVRLAEVQVQAGTAALLERPELCRASWPPSRPPSRSSSRSSSQSDDLLATLVGHVPAEWSAPQVTSRRSDAAGGPAGEPAVATWCASVRTFWPPKRPRTPRAPTSESRPRRCFPASP